MGQELSFNIFDQAALTGVINRPMVKKVESDPTIGERIMPLFDVQSRQVKLRARDVEAFGLGQYRAPGATPPLVEFQSELEENVVSLVLLDEMHRINDEDYLNLQSADANQRAAAGLSIVERGNALAIRNRRLTEALRWQAFSGEVVVTYQSGSQVKIDYGITQKPTSSDDWADTANSDPIADLKAWQKLPNVIGEYGLNIHIGSDDWENVLNNDKLTDYLTGTDRPLMVPKEEDVMALLRPGTNIIVTDAGYRATGVGTDRSLSSRTPYLPKGKVLITTPYSVDGEPIADMPDGQVIVSTGYNSVAIRQGPQSEVMLEHMSKTHFIRYASARIPRIRVPEAFVYADITGP